MQQRTVLLGVTLASLLAVPADAATFSKGCTTEPQGKWMAMEAVQAKAVSLGYAVAKAKVAGTCYEVYATKDAKRFELFFNPMTAELIHTEAK